MFERYRNGIDSSYVSLRLALLIADAASIAISGLMMFFLYVQVKLMTSEEMLSGDDGSIQSFIRTELLFGVNPFFEANPKRVGRFFGKQCFEWLLTLNKNNFIP